MRFETSAPFGIFEDPGPDGIMADGCWETALAGFELPLRGGFTMTRRPTFHTGGAAAERDAGARLTFRNELEAGRVGRMGMAGVSARVCFHANLP